MANDKDIYDAMCMLASQRMPGFKVAYKDQSTVMKILGVLSKPWCPTFMTRYTTTLGMTVYYPSKEYVDSDFGRAWKILAHEITHGTDYLKNPLLFVFGYSAPQILATLAITVIGAFWWKWSLLALLFLLLALPWPSPGRSRLELRGYQMSMAVNFWRYGTILQSTKDWILEIMTGWDYYKMCWSKTKATEMVNSAVSGLENGSVLKDGDYPNPFKDVYGLLKSLNAVK